MVRRVGFVVKHHQPEAQALASLIVRELIHEKIQVFFESDSRALATRIAKQLSSKIKIPCFSKNQLIDKSDLIIVLGGDGTYLSIARLMRSKSVPVMGINAGKLGFLTEIKQTEALDVIHRLIAGEELSVSERSLLDVRVLRGKKTVFSGPVVNDVVIAKGAIARIIDLQVWIDGHFVNEVRADGIIISTPTGATAYSLAAGGPIVEPQVPALIVTPICPHSLTQRSLVVSENSEISIRLSRRSGSVLVTLDGQDVVPLKTGDVVEIKRFTKHALQLVSSPDRDYYGLIREKLQFGGTLVQRPS